MGYISHHAIVVTSWDEEKLEEARTQALRYCRNVSEITTTGINRYRSFLIPPDGSKEDWEESDQADIARAQFLAWVNRLRDPGDGSSGLDWVEVRFGGDGPTTIERHSGEDPPAELEEEIAARQIALLEGELKGYQLRLEGITRELHQTQDAMRATELELRQMKRAIPAASPSHDLPRVEG